MNDKPAIVELTRDTWVPVAINVTQGAMLPLEDLQHQPRYGWTWRATGQDAPPEGIFSESVTLAPREPLVFDFPSAVDIYMVARDFDGKVRADVGLSQGPTVIYVADSGSDEMGDGTATNPYATVTKAYSYVPYMLEQPYTIKIANGSYTDFPVWVDHRAVGTGQLFFDGYEGPISEGDTYTIGTVTAFVDSTGIVQLIDAVMTPNDMMGKYVRIVDNSGDPVGIFPIYDNTEDTVTTALWGYSKIMTGFTADIVSPGVIVSTVKATIFQVEGISTWTTNAGTFNLDMSASEAYATYQAQGNTSLGLFLTNLRGTSHWGILEMKGASDLNKAGPVDPTAVSGFASGFGDYNYFLYATTVLQIDAVVAGELVTDIAIYQGEEAYIGRMLNRLCCRNDIALTAGTRTDFYNVGCGHVAVADSAFAYIEYMYIRGEVTSEAISTANYCQVKIEGVTIGAEVDTVVRLGSLSSMVMSGQIAGVQPANYILRVGALGSVKLDVNPSLHGVVNDVYFERSTTAAAFPTVGNARTDNQGSYVLR